MLDKLYILYKNQLISTNLDPTPMKQRMPDIEQLVIDILHIKMGVVKQRISSQAHLMRELGLDSLDAVELIVEIEKNFTISISDEELEGFVTLQDVINCIQNKLLVEE